MATVKNPQGNQKPTAAQNNTPVDDKTSPFDILLQETKKMLKQVFLCPLISSFDFF